MKRIYLDHAATTPLHPDVLTAMQPFLTDRYGNPSSLYGSGREVRRAIDAARDEVAAGLGADSPREIIFTGGGSEADNLAIKGVAWARREEGRHIVVSAIEHHAVLHAARALEAWGFETTVVAPDSRGIVSADAVSAALRDDTILVSVMHANNETGVLQPIPEIAAVARARGATFHTDAVQSVGHLPIDVGALHCDLLSLSAHKFYGPKGVGALYARRGVPLEPLIHGGGQEQERRAGTENAAGIVGLAEALRLSLSDWEAEHQRVSSLRDRLVARLTDEIPDVRLNGEGAPRLPGHANLSFAGVDGESLLLNLDMHGVEASSGSACTSGSIEASHVLRAMGVPRDLVLSSIRFSLGKGNTQEEVERTVDVVRQLVERLRRRRS